MTDFVSEFSNHSLVVNDALPENPRGSLARLAPDLSVKTAQAAGGTVTAGTRVATLRGAVRAHDLRPGDLVLTRDNGYQPIVALQRETLTAAHLSAYPDACPVRLSAGVLDGLEPLRPFLASPALDILLVGAKPALLFGASGVLIPVAHLTAVPGVRRVVPARGASFVSVRFAAHEVFMADGVWCSSLAPDLGDGALRARLVLNQAQTRQLLT